MVSQHLSILIPSVVSKVVQAQLHNHFADSTKAMPEAGKIQYARLVCKPEDCSIRCIVPQTKCH